MNPSSTSSSRTLHIAGWQRSLVTMAVAVVCFGVLDTVARFTDPFHLYGGWENPIVHTKVENARRMKREQGRVDVLLMATSVGLYVDVDKWTEATGGAAQCYNAALPAMRPEFGCFLFENFYFPELRPKKVIYLVAARDVNHYGLSGKYRPMQQFWESHQTRSRTAATPAEKAVVALESASYLYQARQHVRRLVQSGPIPQDPVDIIRPTGVYQPAIQKRTGKAVPDAELAGGSPYARFSMPEDGELAHLWKLARFCKAQGVEFVLVNMPVAPSRYAAFDNPTRDYGVFLGNLRRLEKGGVRFVDMAGQLPMRDSDFSDNDHVNRWGGHLVADFLYKQVIRGWYPNDALVSALPDSAEIPLASLLKSDNGGFYLQNRRAIPAGRFSRTFAAPLQVTTDRAGGALAPLAPVSSGRYLVEVYGSDERTTPTGKVAGHNLVIGSQPASGGTAREKKAELPRVDVSGSNLLSVPVDMESSSRLTLGIASLAGPECVLDTVFVRPMVAKGLAVLPDVSGLARDSAVVDPVLIRNGDFEFADPRRPGMPSEWFLSTGDREPWGAVRLVEGGRNGGRALEISHDKSKGWGCLVQQEIGPVAVKALRGKSLEFSFWVRDTARPALSASVETIGAKQPPVRFVSVSTEGKWSRVAATLHVPEAATAVLISAGAVDGSRVVLDSFGIKPNRGN